MVHQYVDTNGIFRGCNYVGQNHDFDLRNCTNIRYSVVIIIIPQNYYHMDMIGH